MFHGPSVKLNNPTTIYQICKYETSRFLPSPFDSYAQSNRVKKHPLGVFFVYAVGDIGIEPAYRQAGL